MNTVLILHDLTRWLILVSGLLVTFLALKGYLAKTSFGKVTNLSGLIFMIFMDIQIIFGLLLYFNNGWFEKLKHLNVYIKDTNQRFFTLEHWLFMLIAWILVHAGRNAVKSAKDPVAKNKKSLIYFGIAILLILIAIPWPFRAELGRPWMRWFE